MQYTESINIETIPVLMPNQYDPFNGDKFVEKEILFLKEKWGIENVIESGTCFGSSTLFFAQHFDKVATIEVNPNFSAIAQKRFDEAGFKNITMYNGSSNTRLLDVIKETNSGAQTLFFLDAHSHNHCPLLDELRQIKEADIRPIIVIHDFKVPDNPTLGYDTYHGKDLSIEYVQDALAAIYNLDWGMKSYDFYYNNESEAIGAKRGVIFITPQQRVRLCFYDYTPSNLLREAELLLCRKRNVQNELIDDFIEYNTRRPFSEMFEDTRYHDPTDITIIANSDIIVDEAAVALIKKRITRKKCFALTRWDLFWDGDSKFFDRKDSQDVWVFQGAIMPYNEDAEFPLGMAGSDNAIAYILHKMGYQISNPSLDIKVWHVHNSNYRTYNPMDKVDSPYKLLPPCKLTM